MFKQTVGVALSACLYLSLPAVSHADPTRPPGGSGTLNNADTGARLQPKLQAIMRNDLGEKVIINNHTYIQTERKNGIEVVAIHSDSVDIKLERDGRWVPMTLAVANTGFLTRSVKGDQQ